MLNGLEIESSGYATSDERGWCAIDCKSGFVNDRNSPAYFIEFEKGVFPIEDRRSSTIDARYGISKYSLKDIKTIRKGINSRGEIVYSKNQKEKDIKEKKRIGYLKSRMRKLNKDNERAHI